MYKPNPTDTSDVELTKELFALAEEIAEQVHEVWALGRYNTGWRYGECRNDAEKTTPCMVPYKDLPESEKVYDRETAMNTIRLLVKRGYEIKKKE